MNLAHFRDAVLIRPSAEIPLYIITYWKRINSSLNTFQEHRYIIILKLSVTWHLLKYKLLEKERQLIHLWIPAPGAAFRPLKVLRSLSCSEEDSETQSWPQILFLALSNCMISKNRVWSPGRCKSWRAKPWRRRAWIRILALSLPSSEILGKFLNISVRSFVICKIRMTAMVPGSEDCWGLHKLIHTKCLKEGPTDSHCLISIHFHDQVFNFLSFSIFLSSQLPASPPPHCKGTGHKSVG